MELVESYSPKEESQCHLRLAAQTTYSSEMSDSETTLPDSPDANPAPAPEGQAAAPSGTSAPAASASVEMSPELRACIQKIRETIQADLDEAQLHKVLHKHVRKLRNWPKWSEPAREAYAHLLAAEMIHARAASICVQNGISLDPDQVSEYERSLQALQTRPAPPAA